ncbi:MAG: fumarylacetoacetate hydrolase family protein [Parvularculaceae bacterium]
MSFVIDPPPQASVAVAGGGRFPVRRIFCIGRNYADHIKEMGGDPRDAPPVFFTKPADAVVESGAAIPYPLATENLHYEGELVAALGSGGAGIAAKEALAHVFGYAAGCDLTRRDRQAGAKKAGGPWDASKAFDYSAPLGAIMRAGKAAGLDAARLALSVNGETRQDAPLSSMVWTVPEIIAALSEQFELKAGDLIFTGTPDGVGPLAVGDKVEISIGALPVLSFEISEKE